MDDWSSRMWVSAFSMGDSAISLVAAYVSVTQSWVISPSSSNTNSVIADIIHEDGFVTGARCITIFGAVRVANQFPQREEVTEVTFAWFISADTAWGHFTLTVWPNTIPDEAWSARWAACTALRFNFLVKVDTLAQSSLFCFSSSELRWDCCVASVTLNSLWQQIMPFTLFLWILAPSTFLHSSTSGGQ